MKYNQLVKAIDSASQQLLARAASVVNQSLVIRNWTIGASIVRFEQKGEDRAKYGARLLERLAEDLTKRGLRGLDTRSLRDCRLLFQVYPQIRGTLSPESKKLGLRTTAGCRPPIRGTVSPELPTPLSPRLVLQFSWSQLQELIRLDDPLKRAFYENECLKGSWSVRQLQRQIDSLLFERTGLSKNKAAVIKRARAQEPQETIEDLIRDPYVLEFTGLAERAEYHESDLEKALLDHLQRFLLELGAGFCFEARQFRVTIGNKHDYVDLVFYHRLLRCHLLLDLKGRRFLHRDAGQMNFYLNYFKNEKMAPGDNPPVGVILCSDRDRTEVAYATAGMDNKLFVSRYLTVLPSAEKLQRFVETDRAQLEAAMGPRARSTVKPRPTKSKSRAVKRATKLNR
jgi:predicted nuclease of restriction endonuclease-like (RecB) superfamily